MNAVDIAELPSRCRLRGRGVATLEAVLVLPVLILVFVSVAYVFSRYDAEQTALLEAQSCAWRASAGNCQSVPAGCQGLLSSRALDIQPPRGPLRELLAIARNVPPLSLVHEVLTAPLQALAGPAVHALATRELSPHPLLQKRDQERIHRGATVSCNLEPVTSLSSLIDQFWAGVDRDAKQTVPAEDPSEPVPEREPGP